MSPFLVRFCDDLEKAGSRGERGILFMNIFL